MISLESKFRVRPHLDKVGGLHNRHGARRRFRASDIA
jgi:hypothetical protein